MTELDWLAVLWAITIFIFTYEMGRVFKKLISLERVLKQTEVNTRKGPQTEWPVIVGIRRKSKSTRSQPN